MKLKALSIFGLFFGIVLFSAGSANAQIVPVVEKAAKATASGVKKASKATASGVKKGAKGTASVAKNVGEATADGGKWVIVTTWDGTKWVSKKVWWVAKKTGTGTKRVVMGKEKPRKL
ncbi:MAG: hypothetical protein R2681_03220 [Pyrinomonadaceae bacterium]